MTEKLELFKIVTHSGKKKLYESSKQFDRNWDRHVDDRKRFMTGNPVLGYKLQLQHNGSFAWTQIKKSV